MNEKFRAFILADIGRITTTVIPKYAVGSHEIDEANKAIARANAAMALNDLDAMVDCLIGLQRIWFAR